MASLCEICREPGYYDPATNHFECENLSCCVPEHTCEVCRETDGEFVFDGEVYLCKDCAGGVMGGLDDLMAVGAKFQEEDARFLREHPEHWYGRMKVRGASEDEARRVADEKIAESKANGWYKGESA